MLGKRLLYAILSPSVLRGGPPVSILDDVKEIQTQDAESDGRRRGDALLYAAAGPGVRSLNAALASEIICVLRYQQHYYMTTSIHQEQLQGLFKEHWHDEEEHLERIADRIKQLGGVRTSIRKESQSERFHLRDRSYACGLVARRSVSRARRDQDLQRHHRVLWPSRPGKPAHVRRDPQRRGRSCRRDRRSLYTVDPETGKTVEQFTGDSTSQRFKK